MRRSQFSLKTMLWLMAVVTALLGGREWGIRREHQRLLDYINARRFTTPGHLVEMLSKDLKPGDPSTLDVYEP